jgi:hypothetical protein
MIINLTNIIAESRRGAANGVASLDGGGKVPSSQLPSSVMEYKGQWNASTNSPALSNGTGDAGDVYEVSTAGSHNFGAGAIAFNVGDWAVYNGTTWDKSVNSNEVVSVNGKTGAVTLVASDIAGIETEAATGTTIDFTAPKIFNSVSSPATGNFTDNLTGAKIGLVQKIYHNSGTAPTVPAGWVKLGGANYATSALNIIFAEFVGGSRVEYWIV